MLYYHGTHRTRGSKILKNKKMEYSKGDTQWLGDGIYLYKFKIYAYRWITIQYTSHYTNELKNIKEKLYERYMILGVDVNIVPERVFSFINPMHKLEFDCVKEQCEKRKESFPQLQQYKYIDGAIFNIMFKKMNYEERFDMVEAVYILEKNKEANIRQNTFQENQLCIKNPDMITQITDVTNEFPIDEFQDKLVEFNSARTKYKNSNHTYKKRRNNYGTKFKRKV